MPGISSRQVTIGHIFPKPWPLRFPHNQGQWLQRAAFLSPNKRPLRQIVLPRLTRFALFLLTPHEGVCAPGQIVRLIKSTFHIPHLGLGITCTPPLCLSFWSFATARTISTALHTLLSLTSFCKSHCLFPLNCMFFLVHVYSMCRWQGYWCYLGLKGATYRQCSHLPWKTENIFSRHGKVMKNETKC